MRLHLTGVLGALAKASKHFRLNLVKTKGASESDLVIQNFQKKE